jgi:hypothetical protein
MPPSGGTGTLLKIDERHFVITAQHLFEDDRTELNHLALPDELDSNKFTRITGLFFTGQAILHSISA